MVVVMSGRRYLAIGFDMDSTLLKTNIDYERLSRVSFDEMRKMGVPDNVIGERESSRFNRERGIDFLMRNGRADDAAKVKERIFNIFEEIEMKNVNAARPYEGAVDMIMYLKGKGYKVGVLTKGSRKYATAALTVSGVIGMLDALVCREGHDESETKPSPVAMRYLADALGVEPKDILYIGVNEIDYLCARDSGADFIGVLSRYTEDDWRSVGDGIRTMNSVADLMEIL